MKRSVLRTANLKRASGLAIAGAIALGMSTVPASAQIVERGVQGGVAGALIGGIVDGKKGLGKGAAIGAGVGIAAGAIERDRNQRYYAAPPPARYAPPPPAYDGRLVADTQYALTRLGYQPGPVDGVMGPGTSNAIRSYQYAYGLRVTGAPSLRLLDHMQRRGG